jgi:biopolymer transport protein ExbD
MSHGAASSECDPNLTPLLDLVLQLLMFFIVCVNFVAEQVSGDIRLPLSDSAQPIEKADTQSLFLNQKSMKSKAFVDRLTPDQLERLRSAESVVLVPGKDPMTLLECKAWLKQQYEDALTKAKDDQRRGRGDGEVKTVINFRPDEDLELNQLFALMEACKVAGYRKLKMRARVRLGG